MKKKGLMKILMMKHGTKQENNFKIKIFFLKMQFFIKNLMKIHQMIKVILKQFYFLLG
jgi:hypothetical protein